MFSADKLDSNLNLTPMIDVMSVMVAFLLMTAVWQQIAAINSAIETKGAASPTMVTPPKNNRVEVRVTLAGHQVTWPPMVTDNMKVPATVAMNGKKYNLSAVSALFKKVQSKTKIGVSVTGDEQVDYGAVAETIDAIKQSGVDEVALATN